MQWVALGAPVPQQNCLSGLTWAVALSCIHSRNHWVTVSHVVVQLGLYYTLFHLRIVKFDKYD